MSTPADRFAKLSGFSIEFSEAVCNVLSKLSDEQMERAFKSGRAQEAITAEYGRILQAKKQTLK
jgi:hypothetical protein